MTVPFGTVADSRLQSVVLWHKLRRNRNRLATGSMDRALIGDTSGRRRGVEDIIIGFFEGIDNDNNK